ncbi:hypothetical protein V6N13_129834 [Hibiscus sabdariffa]|uniref:Uncharacterized protein n=1 Tax=Hibiscus sabdariffa TaxID=183260 RepID=A0ABR2SMD6_9ROSI
MGKLRTCINKSSVDDSEDEDNNDVEFEGQTFVRNDIHEEDEVRQVGGKSEGHERDYIESDDPREYRESDDEAIDEMCGVYRVKGRKSLGNKYDYNCAFPLWEIGLRFEDHKQFKEVEKRVIDFLLESMVVFLKLILKANYLL